MKFSTASSWSALLAAGSLLASYSTTTITTTNAFVLETASYSSTTTSSRRIPSSSSLRMVSAEIKQPGTAKLDKPWNELGFEFRPTNSHIKLVYKDGKWGKGELVKVGFC